MDGPAVEQHHSNINILIACRDRSLAQAVEVRLIEQLKVELWLPVLCVSRSCALPRLRGHAQVEASARRLRLELFPAPEPDEVVVMLPEKGKVFVKFQRLRRFCALRARTHAIVEVMPDMRTGQIDGFPVRIGCNREVTRVCFRDRQRSGSSISTITFCHMDFSFTELGGS